MSDETEPSFPAQPIVAVPPMHPSYTTATTTGGFSTLTPPSSTAAFGVSIQSALGQNEAFLAKMTDAHLSKVIDQAGKEDWHRYIERLVGMGAGLIVVVFVLALVFALSALYLSYNKSEQATPIITLVLGLVTGSFGGFGVGRATAPSIQTPAPPKP